MKCYPKETANLPPQVLVDETEVERSEEVVVGESPKSLCQSGSEAEDTVQRINSLTQTCARVL